VTSPTAPDESVSLERHAICAYAAQKIATFAAQQILVFNIIRRQNLGPSSLRFNSVKSVFT
jgi:hypothetical protein